LPSDEEWKTLVVFAGDDEIAGKKLKAKKGWNQPDEWEQLKQNTPLHDCIIGTLQQCQNLDAFALLTPQTERL
jgi:hypothetical protein